MTFLFIHGAGCTGDVFGAQLRAFARARAPDLPGRRARPGEPASIAAFADAIEPELQACGGEGVVACGHSMGGAVALELALRAPACLRAVVLLDSGAKLRVAATILAGLESDFAAQARALSRLFFVDPRPELVAAATVQMLAVGREQTIRDFRACDAFDATGRLAGVRIPLLAITGAADALTPPAFGRFVADRVPLGSARILEGAGHFAMQECPEETNAAIAAFVAGIEPR